ncbi:hypothetical protein AOLI_G00079410 [Acnodon oligacanthus]
MLHRSYEATQAFCSDFLDRPLRLPGMATSAMLYLRYQAAYAGHLCDASTAAGVMVSSKDYNQKHLAPLISGDLAVASVARPCVVLVNLHTHPRGSRELTQALRFPLLWPLSMLEEKLSWRSLVE